MRKHEGSCPMKTKRVLDDYFLDNRARLLDIAAFLDRLDRTVDPGRGGDFRVDVFKECLELLLTASANRVEQIQKCISDPHFESKDRPKSKTAVGVYNRKELEGQ